MKSRRPAPALDPQAIDALYGLEPVFEPDAEARAYQDAHPFITVNCPYCGEPFETALDLSEGSARYIEDCQICCQPIEFELEVGADGALENLQTRRAD